MSQLDVIAPDEAAENPLVTLNREYRNYYIWFGCVLGFFILVSFLPQTQINYNTPQLHTVISIPVVLALNWYAYKIGHLRVGLMRASDVLARLSNVRELGAISKLPPDQIRAREREILADVLDEHEPVIERSIGTSLIATAMLWAALSAFNTSGHSPYVLFACLFTLCMLFSTFRYGEQQGHKSANSATRLMRLHLS